MTRNMLLFVGLAAVLMAAAAGCTAQVSGVAYPSGYRDWTHVKSVLVSEQHPLSERFGGMHHVYANALALRAMKDQAPYPDGAVLVFDLLAAEAFDGGIATGQRRRIDVMQRGSQQFAATDGWGYASFKGSSDERVVQDPAESCHACHVSGSGGQKTVNGVFSTYLE